MPPKLHLRCKTPQQDDFTLTMNVGDTISQVKDAIQANWSFKELSTLSVHVVFTSDMRVGKVPFAPRSYCFVLFLFYHKSVDWHLLALLAVRLISSIDPHLTF